MEDVNKRRRISFSLSKLECSPQEMNSREIRLHFCHFQQIGINATKIEKTGILLNLTFSLPLPSSMLKLPNAVFYVQHTFLYISLPLLCMTTMPLCTGKLTSKPELEHGLDAGLDQFFAFPPFSPLASHMTIKRRVFVAIMESKG